MMKVIYHLLQNEISEGGGAKFLGIFSNFPTSLLILSFLYELDMAPSFSYRFMDFITQVPYTIFIQSASLFTGL